MNARKPCTHPRHRWFVLATIWFLAFLVLGTPAPTAQAQTSPLTQGVGIEQQLDAQVPLELTFRDEDGNPVQLGDLLEGRPVILNLVYYQCPMLCNMAMKGLVSSLKTLELDASEDFTLITVSFDPQEKPELAAAAKRTAVQNYDREGTAAHWHFLTGEEPAIRRLADSVGFHYSYDPETKQYRHAAGLIVLTPEGRTSRYLLGVEYPARDLRLSLVEASQNKIGSITDQVLLLCYQYDPSTGKYGLLIQNVMRLAGMVTVVAIGGSVGMMLLVERRKNKHPATAAEETTSPGDEQ